MPIDLNPPEFPQKPGQISRRKFLGLLASLVTGSTLGSISLNRTNSLVDSNATLADVLPDLEFDGSATDSEAVKNKIRYLVSVLNFLATDVALSQPRDLSFRFLEDASSEGSGNIFVRFVRQEDGTYTTSRNEWQALLNVGRQFVNSDQSLHETNVVSSSFGALVSKLKEMAIALPDRFCNFDLTVRVSKSGIEKATNVTLSKYSDDIKKCLQSFGTSDYKNSEVLLDQGIDISFDSTTPQIRKAFFGGVKFTLQSTSSYIELNGPLAFGNDSISATITEIDTNTQQLIGGQNITIPLGYPPYQEDGIENAAQRIPLIGEEAQTESLLRNLFDELEIQRLKIEDRIPHVEPSKVLRT